MKGKSVVMLALADELNRGAIIPEIFPEMFWEPASVRRDRASGVLSALPHPLDNP